MWSRAQLLSRWDFLLLSDRMVRSQRDHQKNCWGPIFSDNNSNKSVAVVSLRSIVMVAVVVLVVVIVGNEYSIYIYTL